MIRLGSLAGYAYARHASQSRLMNGTLWGLMMTRMTPSLALILPFFILFKTFGLLDTRTALVIAYCSLILPLSTWMMKGYFEGLPPNLERAALVDGCTRLQAIWKVIAPVARPGIVAAVLRSRTSGSAIASAETASAAKRMPARTSCPVARVRPLSISSRCAKRWRHL